jgi:hypothetical protein
MINNTTDDQKKKKFLMLTKTLKNSILDKNKVKAI